MPILVPHRCVLLFLSLLLAACGGGGSSQKPEPYVSAAEPAPVEVDTAEADTAEVDTVDVGTVAAGTVEVGTVEVGTVEVGTVEVGTVEVGTGEVGTVEVGTGEVGTGEVGTGEVGIVVGFETVVDVEKNRNHLNAVVELSIVDRSTVDITQAMDDWLGTYFQIKLTGGDADWDQSNLPIGCRATEVARIVKCGFDRYDLEVARRWRLPINASHDALIEVDAIVAPDANTSADLIAHAQDSIEYRLIPDVDYRIEVADTITSNNTEYTMISARIHQESRSGASNVVVDVTPSEGITVAAAELFSSGDQPLISRCELGTVVSCTMDSVMHYDILTLELTFILNTDQQQSIDWKLTTDAVDSDLKNNVGITQVEMVQSVSLLQNLIDQAETDSVVQFPSGRYAGTLDLGSKRLHLRGSDDGQATILESHTTDAAIFTGGARYSSASNFILRTSGGLILDRLHENFDLSDSLIEPLPGRQHAVVRLFDSASYRIRNSTIRGFGSGEGNTCKSLFDQPQVRYGYSTSIYLERNFIVGNDCDQLVMIRSPSWYPLAVDYFLNNNTLIANPVLLRVAVAYYDDRSIHFVNNIIHGAKVLLDLPDTAFLSKGFSGRGLYSSRNILIDSERAAILTGTLVAREGVELGKTDLIVDPLFIDAEIGDYRLSFNSPAIDQGDQPSEYLWTYDDYRYEHVQPADSDKIQPIDGSLDGHPQFDIGAFEYDPGATE